MNAQTSHRAANVAKHAVDEPGSVVAFERDPWARAIASEAAARSRWLGFARSVATQMDAETTPPLPFDPADRPCCTICRALSR